MVIAATITQKQNAEQAQIGATGHQGLEDARELSGSQTQTLERCQTRVRGSSLPIGSWVIRAVGGRSERTAYLRADARKIVAAPTDPVTTGGIQHANHERGNLPI